jgi:hypothetical protein
MGGLCSIAIEFKIFEMMLSCSILKKKQIRGGTFVFLKPFISLKTILHYFIDTGLQ